MVDTLLRKQNPCAKYSTRTDDAYTQTEQPCVVIAQVEGCLTHITKNNIQQALPQSLQADFNHTNQFKPVIFRYKTDCQDQL